MNLRPQHLSLLSFTAGLVVGGVASFLVTKHFVEKKERAIATDEIEQIKNHYRIVRKEGDLADPEKAAMVFNQTVILPEDPTNAYGEQSRGADFDENYPKNEEDLKRVADKIASLGYDAATAIIGQTMDEERDLEEVVDEHIERNETKAAEREQEQIESHLNDRRNVFSNGVTEADVRSIRDPNVPYIITFNEWANPDDEFESYELVTMKYYAPDNVLLDSQDGITPENMYDSLVGIRNLTKFGHSGSEGPDMLYVRNEEMSLSIEIIRHNQSYVESLGLHLAEDEEPRRKRKVRPED